MACIPCQRKKTSNMEDQIKKLAASGKNPNIIAAMLMVHKEYVLEVLSADSTVKTVKTKKSKSEE